MSSQAPRETGVGSDGAEVLESVGNLGNRIADAWRKAHYSRREFPAIAAQALADYPVSCDHRSLAQAAIFASGLPYQQYFETPFGEPPITLYWHPSFYIEALCWTSGTPAIHNHAFSGAFRVVQGASLQATYRFEEELRAAETLRLGRLAAERVDLLTLGSVEEIRPRDRLIHSVWHLADPSITLVVRTHSEMNREGRFEYLPPSTCPPKIDPAIM